MAGAAQTEEIVIEESELQKSGIAQYPEYFPLLIQQTLNRNRNSNYKYIFLAATIIGSLEYKQLFDGLAGENIEAISICACDFLGDIKQLLNLFSKLELTDISYTFNAQILNSAQAIEIITTNNKLNDINLDITFSKNEEIYNFFVALSANTTITKVNLLLHINIYTRRYRHEFYEKFESAINFLFENNKTIETFGIEMGLDDEDTIINSKYFIEDTIKCITYNNTIKKLKITMNGERHYRFLLDNYADLCLIENVLRNNTALNSLTLCVNDDNEKKVIDSILNGLQENTMLKKLKIESDYKRMEYEPNLESKEKLIKIREIIERNNKPMIKSARKR